MAIFPETSNMVEGEEAGIIGEVREEPFDAMGSLRVSLRPKPLASLKHATRCPCAFSLAGG
ncbi:MAG TPA: hypothetical protein VE525_18485 [Rubrobacter sp.]|jgi:hypothetical protein|nr:hypothetical protein [Rubrobacter sp.]